MTQATTKKQERKEAAKQQREKLTETAEKIKNDRL